MKFGLIPYQIYTDGSAKGSDYAHRAGGWSYIISKFHAIVYIEKTFPYFTIRFKNITDAQNFCSELNQK